MEYIPVILMEPTFMYLLCQLFCTMNNECTLVCTSVNCVYQTTNKILKTFFFKEYQLTYEKFMQKPILNYPIEDIYNQLKYI